MNICNFTLLFICVHWLTVSFSICFSRLWKHLDVSWFTGIPYTVTANSVSGWGRQNAWKLLQETWLWMMTVMQNVAACCILTVQKRKGVGNSRSPFIEIRYEYSANSSPKGTSVRQCMYSIHLITAVQVAAGVVVIKWRVKESATVGFITSMFTVWCCCEGEMWDAGAAEWSSAVGLSSEAVTHFMELNTEQTGWRQTLRHTAGDEQHS